jgi:hypothetical protein
LNQWPLLPRYRNRVRVPSGNATDADRVPLDRRRNWCIPGCHPLKSPTTLHPAAGSSASNTNVTLTLLALREILITLVSLTEASNGSVPDNLAPHTTTRRCRDGESDRATYHKTAPRRGLTPEERRRLLAYVDTVKAALRSAPTCPALRAQSKSLCAPPQVPVAEYKQEPIAAAEVQPVPNLLSNPVRPTALGRRDEHEVVQRGQRPLDRRPQPGSGGETRLVAEDTQHPARYHGFANCCSPVWTAIARGRSCAWL